MDLFHEIWQFYSFIQSVTTNRIEKIPTKIQYLSNIRAKIGAHANVLAYIALFFHNSGIFGQFRQNFAWNIISFTRNLDLKCCLIFVLDPLGGKMNVAATQEDLGPQNPTKKLWKFQA